MKLTMLGEDYRYGLSPVSGGYIRANGKGYINGKQFLGDDLQTAVNIYKGAFPGKKPSSPTETDLINIANEYGVNAWDLYKALTSGATGGTKLEQFSTGIQTILNSALQGFTTVTDAIAKIKASGAPAKEQQAAIDYLNWQRAMPWVIGGAAVLIGMLLIAGTRRRSSPPAYVPGRGAYRY